MFERFTAEARKVVVSAQQEARQHRHPHIGTEHLLLGMLRPEAAIAYTVLHEAGVDPTQVRADIHRLIGTAAQILGEADSRALQTIGIDLNTVLARLQESFGPDAMAPACSKPRHSLLRRRQDSAPSSRFTRRAKKILELSLREALRVRHNYIGPEHILLGLLREGDGMAAKILINAGLGLDELREATLRALHRAA
ncbi:MAG: Clp protease [Geodermatophilaceae bacterium]|nr:Clp protease [Geodermatophilaceae bacterium]